MYLAMIKKYWKVLAVSLAMVVAFIAGYKSNNPEEIVRIEEVIVEREVISEKSGEKTSDQTNTVKVITKKPDGSTEVVEIDKSKKESEKTEEKVIEKEKEQSRKEEKIVAKSKYRTGVWIENDFDTRIDPTYRFEAGMRAFGNVWIGTTVNTQKQISLGVSYEW